MSWQSHTISDLGFGRYGWFMAWVAGCVKDDIKQVVAYSTLSQLGYMMAAVAVSAYSMAMFHLVTHAFLSHCCF